MSTTTLEDQIKNRIGLLEKTKLDQKNMREQIIEAVEDDEEYQDLKMQSKAMNRKVSMHKAALLNEPEYKKLQEDIKETNRELKELKSLLTAELYGWTHKEERFDIEDANGQLRRVQFSSKLVKTDQPSMF